MDHQIVTVLSALIGSAPAVIAVCKYVEHLLRRRQAETQQMIGRALQAALQPIQVELEQMHDLLLDHDDGLADVRDEIDQIRAWIAADPEKRPLPDARHRGRPRSRHESRHRPPPSSYRYQMPGWPAHLAS